MSEKNSVYCLHRRYNNIYAIYRSRNKIGSKAEILDTFRIGSSSMLNSLEYSRLCMSFLSSPSNITIQRDMVY